VLELEAQPRHSQSREILTRTPLPGSDSRGLRHRWSLLGVGFCRSCCILPNVPADKGKWSSPIAPPRFAARGRAKCAGRSVRSSASHRRRRHNELCWRWVRVLANLPAAGDGHAPEAPPAGETLSTRDAESLGRKNGDKREPECACWGAERQRGEEMPVCAPHVGEWMRTRL